jgi:hypothetical protein
MSIEPLIAKFIDCGKNHSNLKPDAGFGRSDLHWTTGVYEVTETLVE